MLVYQRVNSIPLNHLTSYPPFASFTKRYWTLRYWTILRPSFIWGFYQKIQKTILLIRLDDFSAVDLHPAINQPTQRSPSLASMIFQQPKSPERNIHRNFPHFSRKKNSYRWVCLKIGYIPNYSHLIGIMISKTIGFRGTNHFQTNPGHPRTSPRNLSWLPGAEASRHSPWSWDLCRSLRSAAAAPPPSARAGQPGARRSCRPGRMVGWRDEPWSRRCGKSMGKSMGNLWEILPEEFWWWSFDG